MSDHTLTPIAPGTSPEHICAAKKRADPKIGPDAVAKISSRLHAGAGEPAADFSFIALAQNDHRPDAAIGQRYFALDLGIAGLAQRHRIELRGYRRAGWAVADDRCCNGIHAVGTSVELADGCVVEHQAFYYHLQLATGFQFGFAGFELPDLAAGIDATDGGSVGKAGDQRCFEFPCESSLSETAT